MANVIITNNKGEDTNETEDLSIIDKKSGTNWIADLLGNSGSIALNKATWNPGVHGRDIYHDDEGNYHMTRDNYNWWAKYIKGQEWIEEEEEALRELGATDEQIEGARDRIYGNDMEDEIDIARKEFGELREKLAA